MYLLNVAVLHVCVVHAMHVPRVWIHVHLHLCMGIDVALYELGGGALVVMFDIVPKHLLSSIGNMEHPLDTADIANTIMMVTMVQAVLGVDAESCNEHIRYGESSCV